MRSAGLVLTLFALTCIASAQEQNRFDFSINGAGVFSKTTTSSNRTVTDKPTKSLEFIGTFRLHLRPKHALEVNLGRTRNSQIFSVPPNSFRVLSSITEFTGDYVFTPFSLRKFQPFLFAGGGALHFTPGNTYVDTFQFSFGAASQTSLAFLYGAGVDYPIWRILALRLQYRGLLYKEPDFRVPSLFFTGAKGHMAEPSVGIVVKF
jgi:opacity protein-like surface antigen